MKTMTKLVAIMLATASLSLFAGSAFASDMAGNTQQVASNSNQTLSWEQTKAKFDLNQSR